VTFFESEGAAGKVGEVGEIIGSATAIFVTGALLLIILQTVFR
jgi:hypothetical protein